MNTLSDVLIIFGSKSNKNVYGPILNYLNKEDITFRICSAHRTPKLLDKILAKTDAKVIIAGAGLAAHLPGVIASKTVKPVIGVPCSDNFDGMDAFLSIVQMPPGIPVLTVGVDAAEEAAKSAKLIVMGFSKVNLMAADSPRKEKAISLLSDFGVNFSESDNFDKEAVNIQLSEKPKSVPDGVLCLNVLLGKTDVESFMNKAKKGLWLGLNRADNAAIAAVQIIGKEKELQEQRMEKEKAVLADDEKLKVI